MANPEWGIKRICQDCKSAYYDFHRLPIICPNCGAEFNPEAVLRSRRYRAPTTDAAKDEVAGPAAVVDDAKSADVENADVETIDDDSDDVDETTNILGTPARNDDDDQDSDSDDDLLDDDDDEDDSIDDEEEI